MSSRFVTSRSEEYGAADGKVFGGNSGAYSGLFFYKLRFSLNFEYYPAKIILCKIKGFGGFLRIGWLNLQTRLVKLEIKSVRWCVSGTAAWGRRRRLRGDIGSLWHIYTAYSHLDRMEQAGGETTGALWQRAYSLSMAAHHQLNAGPPSRQKMPSKLLDY